MIDVVISGDGKRSALAYKLRDYYSSLSCVNRVILQFDDCPADAFNNGVFETCSEFILFVGGDVVVSKSLVFIMSYICDDFDVVFLMNGSFRIVSDVDYFVSGAFMCRSDVLALYPMPSEPFLCEEIMWLFDVFGIYRFVALYSKRWVHFHNFSFFKTVSHGFLRSMCRARLSGKCSLFYFPFDFLSGVKGLLFNRVRFLE